MPYHYKKFKPGSPEYKKAYAEHMVKKLKKKRRVGSKAGNQAIPPGSIMGGGLGG